MLISALVLRDRSIHPRLLVEKVVAGIMVIKDTEDGKKLLYSLAKAAEGEVFPRNMIPYAQLRLLGWEKEEEFRSICSIVKNSAIKDDTLLGSAVQDIIDYTYPAEYALVKGLKINYVQDLKQMAKVARKFRRHILDRLLNGTETDSDISELAEKGVSKDDYVIFKLFVQAYMRPDFTFLEFNPTS